MAKINYTINKYKEKLKDYHMLFMEDKFLDNGEKLKEFINIFDNVSDSRIKLKCTYSTKFIVVITFLAFLDIRETWQEIADFAEDKRYFLEQFIEYPETLPVHDTYMRVFSKINSDTLENAIIEFLTEAIDLVVNQNITKDDEALDIMAIDGKALKGSGRLYNTDNKIQNNQIMHFWDVSNQLCVKSVVISEKTNEIPTAQQVLPTLNIKNKIITADAMNCQKETVRIIREGQAHYVLAIKGNHSEFYQDIEKHFTNKFDEIKNTNNYFKMEIEKNHHQVEVREFLLVKANSFYQGDEWKDLKSIVCHKKKLWNVHSKTESIEYRYFISDLNDVETISLAIRGHWSVENQLHYSLDKFFNEDANKTIDKIANNNLSLIRKMINTLLVLIAPMFRNGSKMRTLKSFRSNYEINLLRLFKFLDGKDLKELLLQKEKDINLK